MRLGCGSPSTTFIAAFPCLLIFNHAVPLNFLRFLQFTDHPSKLGATPLLVNNKPSFTRGKGFIHWTSFNPPNQNSSKDLLSPTTLSHPSQPSSYFTPSPECYLPTRPISKMYHLPFPPPHPLLPLSALSRTRSGVPAASAPSSSAVSLRSSESLRYG